MSTGPKVIGPDVKCMQSMLFIKASGKPGQAWHQDECAFYSSWANPSLILEQRIDFSIDVLGVKMMGAPNKEWADYGRQKTGRTMPV